MRAAEPVERKERILLVGVSLRRANRAQAGRPLDGISIPSRDSLDELQELAESAGANVVGQFLQLRDAPDPATLVGRGKLEEIRSEARARSASLIVFDHDLTPVQLRNVEKGIGCRAIDRTQLILDIFATHARTREGQLQVELAQLSYLLPRLAGRGEALSRLGGGIGTRGPGEQKLETDRRRIRERVRKIREAIETVRRQRRTRRRARQAMRLGMVALVGYTNAGKSTLFNALTGAGVLTSPKMFATLDPTIRGIGLPSRRRVLLLDTVGFLRDLPPGLVAAFHATLEELQEAALVLHVTDVSNPHHTDQDAEVIKVLRELGIEDRPRIHVLNKVDQLTDEERNHLRNGNGYPRDKVFASAVTGMGLETLLERIDAAMPVDPLLRLRLRLPVQDGQRLSLVQARGRILRSTLEDDYLLMDVELPESAARPLREFVED
jgi:GTPase